MNLMCVERGSFYFLIYTLFIQSFFVRYITKVIVRYTRRTPYHSAFSQPDRIKKSPRLPEVPGDRDCSQVCPGRGSRMASASVSWKRNGPGNGQTLCRSPKQGIKRRMAHLSPISPPKAALEPIRCKPQLYSLRYGMARSKVSGSFPWLQVKSREGTGMRAVLRIRAPDRQVAGDRGGARSSPGRPGDKLPRLRSPLPRSP